MGVVWLTYTNVINTVPPPEEMLLIDNSGGQVFLNGLPVVIPLPVQVIDNSGGDVTSVIL